MTPLLVATGGYIPCRDPLKIATSGYIGSCDVALVPSGRGGYVPPKILKGTLRRKDEEILEQIYRLIETAEEVQAPKIKAKAQKVETRAKTYLNTETPDLTPLIKSIQRIEKEIQVHIQEMKDEDNAIQALLSII